MRLTSVGKRSGANTGTSERRDDDSRHDHGDEGRQSSPQASSRDEEEQEYEPEGGVRHPPVGDDDAEESTGGDGEVENPQPGPGFQLEVQQREHQGTGEVHRGAERKYPSAPRRKIEGVCLRTTRRDQVQREKRLPCRADVEHPDQPTEEPLGRHPHHRHRNPA